MTPNPTGRGLLLVINPGSGTSKSRPDPLPLIADRLPEAHIHLLTPGESVQAVLTRAVQTEPAPQIIGIHGGDGSVIAAAGIAAEAGLPLLVLPGGTFNHFALAIGIKSLTDGIDALQRGEGAPVDLAEVDIDGHTRTLALNTISVGVYPRFVEVRSQLEPRLGRRLAAVVAALRAAVDASPLELTIDGSPVRIWSLFIGVGQYGPPRGAPVRRVGVDDGRLDVRLAPLTLRSRGRGFLTLAKQRSRRSGTEVVDRSLDSHARSFTERAVHISTADTSAMLYAHDGEIEQVPAAPAGHHVTIRSIPAATWVFRRTDHRSMRL